MHFQLNDFEKKRLQNIYVRKMKIDDLKIMSTKEELKSAPKRPKVAKKAKKSDSVKIRKSKRNTKKIVYEEKENIEPLNNRFLRESGMAASTLKMEYIPVLFFHFPKELSYGYIRFEGNGKIPLGR